MHATVSQSACSVVNAAGCLCVVFFAQLFAIYFRALAIAEDLLVLLAPNNFSMATAATAPSEASALQFCRNLSADRLSVVMQQTVAGWQDDCCLLLHRYGCQRSLGCMYISTSACTAQQTALSSLARTTIPPHSLGNARDTAALHAAALPVLPMYHRLLAGNQPHI